MRGARSLKRWLIAAAVTVVGVVIVLSVAHWLHQRRGAEVAALPNTAPKDPDRETRRLVVGTWTDNYQGKRTMTLNEDGTGTMVVELSGWRAALSARRLRFDMRWSIDDGCLKKRTVGGEPSVEVQLILKSMGDSVDEPILELTDTRVLLLDRDGKTQYDWRRVKP